MNGLYYVATFFTMKATAIFSSFMILHLFMPVYSFPNSLKKVTLITCLGS